MEKWSIEKMTEYWDLWECYYGESFIDYFVDINIRSIGIVVGFFCGRFPELGKYILEASNYKLPWNYIQEDIYKEKSGEDIPSISYLVELFYNVEDEEGNWYEENYEKEIYAWCSLIHDIDIYYERFMNWVDEQDKELIQKLN